MAPELTPIGPAGPVQIGGRAPSFHQEGEVSKAFEAGSQEIIGQATKLLRELNIQKLRQSDATAQIKYTDKLNKLYKNTAEIQDLDKQQEFFTKGLAGIKDDLVKDVPNMTGATVRSIADRMSNDDKSFFLKNVEDKFKQGHNDLLKYVDDATRTNSTIVGPERVKEDAKVLSHLDDSRKRGFISADGYKDLKDKFIYGGRLEDLKRLAREHPDQIVGKTAAEVNLRPSDFNPVRDKAVEELSGKYNIAIATHKGNEVQDQEYAIAHPEVAEQYYREGRIPKPLAENLSHHLIQEHPDNNTLSASLQDDLYSFKGSKEDYTNHYIRDIVPQFRNMSPNNKQQVEMSYREHQREMTSALGISSTESYNTVFELLKGRMYQSGLAFSAKLALMASVGGVSVNNFNDKILRDVRVQLREAKDVEAQQKVVDDAVNRIEKYYTALSKPPETIKPTEPKKPESEPEYPK